jgi:hypothetical protein
MGSRHFVSDGVSHNVASLLCTRYPRFNETTLNLEKEYTMPMHPTTYEYVVPTADQIAKMARVRAAAKAFSDVLEKELPDGPDKTFVIRSHRSNAMWANTAITRHGDGSPRQDVITWPQETAKIHELKEGDAVILDYGFTCHGPGQVTIKKNDQGLLYFDCADGQHHLIGQLAEDMVHLVGIYRDEDKRTEA